MANEKSPLSQVLMSLSARHQRHLGQSGVKEEPGAGPGDHLRQEAALQHSPEISSTQGMGLSINRNVKMELQQIIHICSDSFNQSKIYRFYISTVLFFLQMNKKYF